MMGMRIRGVELTNVTSNNAKRHYVVISCELYCRRSMYVCGD